MPDDRSVMLDRSGLDTLIATLRQRGHRVVGPVLGDGVIQLGEVRSIEDLPAGWDDEQSPGRYRLHRRDDDARFGHTVGPGGVRGELFPAEEVVVRLRRRGESFESHTPPPDPVPLALLGVRGCDVAAMAISDRVVLGGDHPDTRYAHRRRDVLVIGVDCARAVSTCFCTSMGTGPTVPDDVDVRLSELPGPDGCRYLARPGTDRGRELLAGLPATAARPADLEAAERSAAGTAASIGRVLATEGLARTLAARPEHPRWDDVAERCLACGNCTLVCPTCFCSTLETTTDLAGTTATTTRRWDSCFETEHSWINGGAVHPDTRSRYRQWLTHKLSTWWDQFDTSGCVGCGRCITWCPVGIDLTAEATAISTTGPGAGP